LRRAAAHMVAQDREDLAAYVLQMIALRGSAEG
jgi:hypothetical protein